MLRHGGSQPCAVEGAYAPRMSRQERRGVLEFFKYGIISTWQADIIIKDQQPANEMTAVGFCSWRCVENGDLEKVRNSVTAVRVKKSRQCILRIIQQNAEVKAFDV